MLRMCDRGKVHRRCTPSGGAAIGYSTYLNRSGRRQVRRAGSRARPGQAGGLARPGQAGAGQLNRVTAGDAAAACSCGAGRNMPACLGGAGLW